MNSHQVISADSHVNEPEAAWSRIPKKLREKGPHYVQDPEGKKGLYLVIEGHKPDPVGQTFTAGIDREPAVMKDRVENFTWDRWRGPWDPAARAADMDKDGVWLEVLYPSLARNLYSLSGQDIPLQLAGIQSYNDWIPEYCAGLPKRLVGLGLLSALDIPWSVNELQRCAKLGLKGVVLPAILPKDMSYSNPEFDPLWTVAEEFDYPVHFHIGIRQGYERVAYARGERSMMEAGNRVVERNIMGAPRLLRDLMFGLVLEKHPKMKVVFAEYEVHWILPFMNRFDGEVGRFSREYPGIPHMTALPSEVVRRQIYITFQNDAPGIAGAEAAGLIDNCMWANDYPHGGSTWPNSQNIINAQLKRMTGEERKKLLWDNAAKLYGLN